MLEQQALLLRPWAVFAGRLGNPDRTQAILDAATGTLLGFAGWRRRRGPAWWRWLAGPTLEVYETEDESLLFQVRRTWVLAPRWHVRDAEAHPVGTLRHFSRAWPHRFGSAQETNGHGPQRCRGTWVHDRWGRGFALLGRVSEACLGRWLTPTGCELGTLRRCGSDLLVTFAAELEGDPFARMLLLASVLVRQ